MAVDVSYVITGPKCRCMVFVVTTFNLIIKQVFEEVKGILNFEYILQIYYGYI